MHTFIDYYKNEVTLSFEDHPFLKNPKHVWIICLHKNKWLLTRHKERGLEFPGGKVEKGETAKQGAIREVIEETGGLIDSICYVGQYVVSGKRDTIVKNVYFATIKELVEQKTYFETDGPVLLDAIPTDVKQNDLFSFIMKDDILPYCLKVIKENYRK